MAARASKFRIAEWLFVDTDRLDQVKGELADGHPAVISTLPNRDFHRLRGSKVWRAGWPKADDEGGHAVTVVGYSERGQYFAVMNSWGRRWGERGFGRISYDTFRKRVKYVFSMRLTEPRVRTLRATGATTRQRPVVTRMLQAFPLGRNTQNGRTHPTNVTTAIYSHPL